MKKNTSGKNRIPHALRELVCKCVLTNLVNINVVDKEVCCIMDAIILSGMFLFTGGLSNAITLTSSSDTASVGVDFTFSCKSNANVIQIVRDGKVQCTITGAYPNGTCSFFSYENKNYKYRCNNSTGVYNLTIPSSFDIDTLHGGNWQCGAPNIPASSGVIQLYVYVPITQVYITTKAMDDNPPGIILNRNKTFTCTTNAGRPSSMIQWYKFTDNITGLATPQPDVCNTNCNGGKFISSSELTYTGIKSDDGKVIYCTAVNGKGQTVRSENKSIVIWYGPSNVTISPKTLMYTVNESTGSVGPVTCQAHDCKPECEVKWIGPKFTGDTSSVLNLRNLFRNQTGNYFCSASNEAWNKTSVNISIIVNYRPTKVTITPLTQVYTVQEITDSVEPIYCTADCKPECTITWNGPNIPDGTSSVLNLQNINRNQTGDYRCMATNMFGSEISVIVHIMVNYGPGQVNIVPNTLIYTVTETTGEIGPITCSAECNPSCSVSWTGPNIRSGALSVLHLQNIDRDQTGSYMCTASNNYGSKTSSAVSVIVDYGPRQVNIIPLKQNYTAIETVGNVGPINCTADCNPECIMTWNGPNLPEGITSVLHLQSINKTQAGYYTCIASNIVSSLASAHINVIVNYGPDYVMISPNQVHYTVNESNSIFPISCISDCKPNCIMTWSGPNLSGDASSVLNLHNIDRSQTGIFMCTASNTVGSKISLGVNVVVNFKPTVDIFGNRTYNENNTVSLSCKVHGVPTAEIKWIFADRIIDSSVLVFVNNNSQVSTLTIRRVGCLSMGSYTCLAKNFIGEDNKAIDIDIKCSPRINDFEYNISTSIAVKDQASLNLTVPIIAYPKPNIYWTHISSGTILNVTQKTSNVFLTNRVFSTLYIANITTVDYGLYRIYAVNDIGKTENVIHSYEVIPKREPMPPFFVYIVCKSTTATIIWKPGFNGDSSDRFYVMYSERGQKVTTKQLDQNEREEPSVSTVTDLKPAIKYDFSIVAKNQFGQSSSRTVICITDAACPLENVSEFKNNENTTMLGAGIGTLVVALLILAAATIVVIRNNLRNKNTKLGISDEYTDIQRSNPTFTDDYSTIQSGIESRPLHEHSINTYEECGKTSDASAYQNIYKMKSGQEKNQKKQVIYDNMEM